jgi:hypothetical protein
VFVGLSPLTMPKGSITLKAVSGDSEVLNDLATGAQEASKILRKHLDA